MNKLLILIFVLNACSNSKKYVTSKTENMEQDKITLVKGESKSITLPNRGARGLQLLFKVDDPKIVEVTQKQVKSMAELDSTTYRPGDEIPAIFQIKGLQEGETHILFYERPAGSDSSRDMKVKNYLIEVSEGSGS
jgi:hypothetical protein